MATKREHAVAILDAMESKVRLRSRTILGVCIGCVFLIAVAILTQWQFGLGGALLIGLLMQLTHERFTVAADAMIATHLGKLGWEEAALEDEASLSKLHEYAGRTEG
jgi:hypothetical protein